ncbi:MAG: hypothetical protein QG639_610, partial [Patescibacteria group bacterium]|nr:hypothetical protein [Patescibacteria group bacterium]
MAMHPETLSQATVTTPETKKMTPSEGFLELLSLVKRDLIRS